MTSIRSTLLAMIFATLVGAPGCLSSDAAADSTGADAAADAPTVQESSIPEADTPDATAPDDAQAEEADATGQDAASESEACQVVPGLGTLACACNSLNDGAWVSSQPMLLTNHFDFGTAGWDASQLSAGGKEILAAGNLGGGSLESEIAAYEVLARCEFASVLKTEGAVAYQDVGGKKTDLLLAIDARKVGVSITRAFHYPPGEPYTVAEAETILMKKLSDIPLSAANATPSDAWERSMLAVLAYDQQHADTIESVWGQLDPALRADVILVVTITDGDDAVLY